MTKLSAVDASMLALIGENQNSPDRVRKLLLRTKGAEARRIANILTSRHSVKSATTSEREAAEAIRGWAAANKTIRK